MGALNNAATLGHDETWRKWAVAAAAYTARLVLNEPENTPNHDKRVTLAKMVLGNPELLQERLAWIMATNPDIATRGETPEAVGEQAVLDEVAALWTDLAELTLPG